MRMVGVGADGDWGSRVVWGSLGLGVGERRVIWLLG